MPKRLAFDRWMFLAVMLLLAVGLVMVYSASPLYERGDAPVLDLGAFSKQLAAGILGLCVMLLAMQIDYRWLKKRSVVYTLLIGQIGLLLAVLMFAPRLNDVRRWLFVFGFSFQPSELAKFVLVIFVAYQVGTKGEKINTPAVLVPCLGATGLLAALVYPQPHLSGAVILVTVGLVVLFLGGLAWRYVVGGALLGIPLLLLGASLNPYMWRRIEGFFGRGTVDTYQIDQSLLALGTGGLTGLGLGDSKQKLVYLPKANSDFIYAIVGEELGFLGAVGLLLLFALLVWRGFRAGDLAPDAFGRVLAWGLSAALAIQILLHMSIVLRLGPTTGVSLPMISFGGSSLIITLGVCGLLLNVSQHQ